MTVGAATLGPLRIHAHVGQGACLWTSGAPFDASSSRQELLAPDTGAPGGAEVIVVVSSRQGLPRLTCPITGLVMDRPVRRYGPAPSHVGSPFSPFVASNDGACTQLSPRMRGWLPNSDSLNGFVCLDVFFFLLFLGL